jgi:hypothetical protein
MKSGVGRRRGKSRKRGGRDTTRRYEFGIFERPARQ